MRKIYSILLCVLCLSAVGCSDDKDMADVALKAIGRMLSFLRMVAQELLNCQAVNR